MWSKSRAQDLKFEEEERGRKERKEGGGWGQEQFYKITECRNVANIFLNALLFAQFSGDSDVNTLI